MQEYTGEKITYVVLQEDTKTEQGELQRRPLIYNTGYGSFTPVGDILGATHFEDQVEAVELADLQNKISTILKQDFNYIVVENYIRRKVVSGEDQEETPVEPEVPVEPEAPIEPEAE